MRYLPVALAALTLIAPAVAAPPAAAPQSTSAAPAAATTPESVPPNWVYMVTRAKLTDTDLTEVAFLRHPAITTLEDCEAERTAGLSTGWVHYKRYYLRTFKGLSYKVDYRCVEGPTYLTYWRKGDLSKHYYLVRTTDAKLDIKPFESFFACRHGLRKVSAGESIDAFCGIGPQVITEAPVDEEPPAELPVEAGAATGAKAATP